VTPGFASVAAPVLDHNQHPVAGVAITYVDGEGTDPRDLSEDVRRAATALTRRLGGPVEGA
jgi:DNA-binding IclR family transcriptional regulator